MAIEQLVGKTIAEFRLEELIGVGAMGAVYRARQLNLERDVALKVLPPDLATQSEYTQRFNREARIAASLEHPNIVPLYDFGIQEGMTYVVMRLLTGGNLAQRLNQRADERGPLPSLGEVSTLLRQMASALDYAHRQGVVHRDIKPSNIMFDLRGLPILVDFGIAKLVDSATQLTAENSVFGTPHYMPPEQWRNEPATPETDQYALAVVVFSLVTGRPPFDAPTSPALMYKHLEEAPPLASSIRPGLPAEIDSVLTRAMAKLPSDRFLTVSAFADAFAAAVAGQEGASTGFFNFPLTREIIESAKVDPRPAAPVPPPSAASKTIVRSPKLPETMPGAVVSPPIASPVTPPPPPPPVSVYNTPPAETAALPAQRQGGGIPPVLLGIGLGALLLALLVCGGGSFIMSQLNPPPTATAPSVIETLESGVVSPTAPTAPPFSTTIAGNITPTGLPLPGVFATVTRLPMEASGTRIAADNAGSIQQTTSFSHEAESVRGVGYTPDGLLLATGDGAGILRLWNLSSGQTQAVLNQGGGAIYSLAVHPNGGLIATAHEDGRIRLWDVANRTVAATLSGHGGPVRQVAFSPDGTQLASASEDNTARLWDLTSTPTERIAFRDAARRVLGVAFSGDGSRVATISEDGRARVYNVADGSRVGEYNAQVELRAVAFRPDGAQLAVSTNDGNVILVDANTFQRQATLTGHSREVFSLAYNLDGTLLASGGRDNQGRVWDITTTSALATLNGHAGWVLGLAFSPDNATLATASGDGTARTWAVGSGATG